MVSFSLKKVYDPTAGRLVKDVKSSDVFNLATDGAVTGDAGTVLCETTTSANKELYITHVALGAYQNSSVSIVAGTSTILPITLGANSTERISGSPSSPLAKVDESTSLKVIATEAGTYTVFVAGVYHPVVSKLETA